MPQQFLKFPWRPKKKSQELSSFPTCREEGRNTHNSNWSRNIQGNKKLNRQEPGLGFLSKQNNYHVPLGLRTENEVMLKTTAVKLQSQANILPGKITQSNSGRTFLNSPTLDSAKTSGKKTLSSLPWKAIEHFHAHYSSSTGTKAGKWRYIFVKYKQWILSVCQTGRVCLWTVTGKILRSAIITNTHPSLFKANHTLGTRLILVS